MNLVQCYHPDFSGGIGDFLRGACYLQKLATQEGWKFYLDWQHHPIGRHISNGILPLPDYSKSQVLDFEMLALTMQADMPMKVRYDTIIQRICDNVDSNSDQTIAVSSFHLPDLYEKHPLQATVEYPLSTSEQEYLQKQICMSKEITDIYKLRNIWNEPQYVYRASNRQKYATVHFRVGDKETLPYLTNYWNELDPKIQNNYNFQQPKHDFEDMYKLLESHINPDEYDYLVLLSDSNDFKEFVKEKKNDNILIIHTNSRHSASKPGLLRSTPYCTSSWTDFDLNCLCLDIETVLCAKKNYSYSTYIWGSGFSIWLSKIFNVPFQAYHLNDV